MEKQLRYNEGKINWTLLDFKSLEEMVRVMEKGVIKYERDNWKKGDNYQALLDSCLRHIFSFLNGEDLDEESNLSHIAHAQCNLMMLMYTMRNRPELDDRYRTRKIKELNNEPLKFTKTMKDKIDKISATSYLSELPFELQNKTFKWEIASNDEMSKSVSEQDLRSDVFVIATVKYSEEDPTEFEAVCNEYDIKFDYVEKEGVYLIDYDVNIYDGNQITFYNNGKLYVDNGKNLARPYEKKKDIQ